MRKIDVKIKEASSFPSRPRDSFFGGIMNEGSLRKGERGKCTESECHAMSLIKSGPSDTEDDGKAQTTPITQRQQSY
jgi:hypothetical protein